ncbi:MAG: hypothetical protein OXH63_14990 [Gemmatimonadetes bacterium]|nr:hypothetical protein [Gemmatimonadota bacterium]
MDLKTESVYEVTLIMPKTGEAWMQSEEVTDYPSIVKRHSSDVRFSSDNQYEDALLPDSHSHSVQKLTHVEAVLNYGSKPVPSIPAI